VSTANGSGSGSLSYTLSRNVSGSKRTGTLTVGGSVVTVTQDSVARPSQVTGLKVITSGGK
jgi:hypothetical protein